MSWTQASIDDVKRAARIEDVVGRDTKVKREGNSLMACCRLPGHDDGTPSVALRADNNTWYCHVCAVGGGTVDWLMKVRACDFPEAMRMLSEQTGVALVDEKTLPVGPRRCVARWDYDDGEGALLYSIERWEPGKGGRSKDFVQVQADGTYKRHPRQVLYRLGEVLARGDGEPVFVVEGEKAADALRKLGLCATTNAGGATAGLKTWTREFAAPLEGAHVVLLPDNDEPGAKLMAHVATVLDGLAASVTTLRLPLKDKGDDVVEWLGEGGTLEQLRELVGNEVQRAQAREGAEAIAVDGDWKKTLRYVGRYLVGSAANLETILENDPKLKGLYAFDDFASRVMIMRQPSWQERKAKYPRPLTDHDTTRLRVYLERVYGVAFADVGAVLSSVADLAAFNPLTDYLKGLKWDGVPRLSTWLTRYASAADTPYVRAVARAWPISAVARAFDPGCQVDTTLVLEGKQGKGKSSLLRALVGDRWFLDHLPDFTSKDAAILVAKAWVHELAELATLSRAEVEKIKQFLVQRGDTYRPPYAANTVDVLRKCVFAATTNRDDYLRDSTGNRRFWPVTTGAVDVEGVAAVRDQLWAEAIVAYRAGESWHIKDPDILAAAEHEQAERLEVVGDPWLAKVRSFAEAQAVLPGFVGVTVDACLEIVGLELAKRTQRDSSRAKDLLRQMGWKEKRNGRTDRMRVWVPIAGGPAGPDDPSSGPAGGGLPDSASGSAENAVAQLAQPETPALSTPHTSNGAFAFLTADRGGSPSNNKNQVGSAGTLGQGRQEAVSGSPSGSPADLLPSWATDDGPDPWSESW